MRSFVYIACNLAFAFVFSMHDSTKSYDLSMITLKNHRKYNSNIFESTNFQWMGQYD